MLGEQIAECVAQPASPVILPTMNALVANPASDEAVPIKERRISKRLRHALDLIAKKGITQREAAKQAGLSEEHLSRSLREPQIQVFIARKMRENVAIGALKGSARLIELVHADSEHVSGDISKHLLAIAGIKPTADAQVSVNIDIKAGYVIDLTDAPISARPAPAMTIEHSGSTSIKPSG